MTVRIRQARQQDIASYTAMMQSTYESAYTDESIGLSKTCFSPAVFESEDTQMYLRSKLVNNAIQKSWVATDNGWYCYRDERTRV